MSPGASVLKQKANSFADTGEQPRSVSKQCSSPRQSAVGSSYFPVSIRTRTMLNFDLIASRSPSKSRFVEFVKMMVS